MATNQTAEISLPQNWVDSKSRMAADVVASVRISDVYRALTGIVPKRGRGVAAWRGGRGLNVALSDPKGTWYDHAVGEGGGVLDLVRRARGCDAVAALHWVAEFAGVVLDHKPLSRADRRQYVRDRRARDRDLPIAEMWRRAACAMGEGILEELKGRLYPVANGKNPQPIIAEIQVLEAKLAKWRVLTGADLVAEYRLFLHGNPRLTSGMVKAVWRRQQAEERVAWRMLGVVA